MMSNNNTYTYVCTTQYPCGYHEVPKLPREALKKFYIINE